MKFWALLAILPSIAFAGNVAFLQQIPLGSPVPSERKPTSETNYWYETIKHNGEASFMQPACKSGYQVFRNVVTDFGADNTGSTDASDAIQNAINAFSSGSSACAGRDQNAYGTTGQPAIIYLPRGTYLMEKSIQMRLGTVLMGDPTDLPTLKAVSSFAHSHIIYAKDPTQPGTNNFYIAIKNLIIDSTDFDKDKTIYHIDWTVSQATQLTNIVFNMPNYSTGHAGVTAALNYPNDGSGYNSALILDDLTFNGGATGMVLNGQQYVLKGMTFNGCNTGIRVNGFDLVVHNSSFSYCTTGIDAHGVSGSLTVLDTVATNIGTLVHSTDSHNARNSIILENVINNGNTVVLDDSTIPPLVGNVLDTWIHGNSYAPRNTQPQFQAGQSITAPRLPALTVDGNNYFAMKPPTYEDFAVDQVVNVKTVANLPVRGDGKTDDTANINAVLLKSVGKLVYFPAGTYIVTDSLVIPPGSRIIGDAYASSISAAFSPRFNNPDAPTAMVKLGNPGDIGVGQISDMLFTVSDVLPGCKLLEVNMAGNHPGDVGIWNSHFRVGGAAGSKVKTVCSTSPDRCMAAWGLLHLTSTSSAYIENMWGWTADHDLDGGPDSVRDAPIIATGRGALIEATKGTWMVGTGMEHNTLYQYNFYTAANVCSIFQQSETPYWQGPGDNAPAHGLAPAPWTNYLQPSDPTFNNCGPEDAHCRMSWFELISGSKGIFLYGGCVWVFFNGGVGHGCQGGLCQRNAIDISKSTGTYLYGTNVKDIQAMIISDEVEVSLTSDNRGGWTGVVAAYLFNSV